MYSSQRTRNGIETPIAVERRLDRGKGSFGSGGFRIISIRTGTNWLIAELFIFRYLDRSGVVAAMCSSNFDGSFLRTGRPIEHSKHVQITCGFVKANLVASILQIGRRDGSGATEQEAKFS